MRLTIFAAGLLILPIITSCTQNQKKGSVEHIQKITLAVKDEALTNVTQHPGDWLTHGLNYAEDRYSTLDQIQKENLHELGLVWSLELGYQTWH